MLNLLIGCVIGCLAPSTMNSEEHFWPSTSDFSPIAERPPEDRKELEEFIHTIGEICICHTVVLYYYFLIYSKLEEVNKTIIVDI